MRLRGRSIAAISILVIVAVVARDRLASAVLRARTHLAVAEVTGALGAERLPVARFSVLGVMGTRASTRGSSSTDLNAESTVARLIGLASQSSSPEVWGAALAIDHKAAQAVEVLRAAAAREPSDARLWSDLSAAHLENAAAGGIGELLQALVAADKALRINPKLVNALYNRGLALDRLGLRIVAADAWRACIGLSTDAELAAAARERLVTAEASSEPERWNAAEKTFLDAAAAGDEAMIDRLVVEFPRFVRASSETYYLTRWAEAVAKKDAKADEWLRVTRAAGAALQRRGDSLVADAVRAIDEASAQHDEPRLAALVAAQGAYKRARVAINDRKFDEAAAELGDAVAGFTAGRSPMESVARYWIAEVLLDTSKIEAAYDTLSGILAREGAGSQHRALVAGSEYFLAICEAFRGHWNAAVDAANDSAALYRQLGDTSSAATSENLVADILDAVGQADVGWRYRVNAFRTTSDAGVANRLLVAVAGGSRAAMNAHDTDLELSLLDVEMSLAELARVPSLTADTLTRRATLQHKRDDRADRDASLERARIAIRAIPNEEERSRLTIELDAAEAVIVRKENPGRALDLLTHAVTFCNSTNRRLYLPQLLLERGRARLDMNDRNAAELDFFAGIDELESQRGAITNLDLRSRMLDTAEDLFDETIALQVGRDNADAAFRIAERGRGRELLDVVEKPPIATVAELAQHLDPDTALVEYAALRDQLVIFSIHNGTMRMRKVKVRAGELSLERKDLYELVLKPVEEDIAPASKVIIVPDKILQRVPFSKYLINTHAVEIAPSASLLVATKTGEAKKQRSVLIVGSPAPDQEQNLDALPGVENEVESLGRIYRPARTLYGPDATKSRFIAEAPNYDVIHFSGHGVSDEESLTASLLFAKTAGDSGRMYMSDIARLRLPRAPLVVLAACGTLRGKAAGVEGMPSLARSFLAVGASTVVGTLWDIDDAKAAPLLESFHRHIVAGDSPAQALRNAQLEAIARGGDDAKPKNWAPFVVYTATP